MVTDPLPAGLTFDSSPDGCTADATLAVVTCTAATLAAGDDITFNVVTQAANPFPSSSVNADGTVVNSATVTSPGTNCPDGSTDADCTSVHPLPIISLLTLVKEVINDDGGSADPTDWTLTADGPTPIAGVTGTPAITDAPVVPLQYPPAVRCRPLRRPRRYADPRPVTEAIADALAHPLATGGVTPGERNAEAIVQGPGRRWPTCSAATPPRVVFGRSATQLTYDVARTLATTWSPGDEVVVTRLDHDSNIRPWIQAADRAGATVRWADFDPATGELTPDDVGAVLSERTRLVAVTAASNLIGDPPDDRRRSPGATHGAAGAAVRRRRALRGARLRRSRRGSAPTSSSARPYKFLGPHHGVLTSRPRNCWSPCTPTNCCRPPTRSPSGSNWARCRTNCSPAPPPPIDVLAGLSGARRAGGRRPSACIGLRGDRATRGSAAANGSEAGLAELPGVTVRSRAARRTPTLLLTFDGREAADASVYLADRGVHAPAGSFYALEASRHLGLGDTGGLRRRALAVQRQGRRRPAAGGPGGLPAVVGAGSVSRVAGPVPGRAGPGRGRARGRPVRSASASSDPLPGRPGR